MKSAIKGREKMDIKTLETSEIVQLIGDLNGELKRRSKQEKENLIHEIREKAQALNIPLNELLEAVEKPIKVRKEPSPPKYHNPENNSQTWSGRGKRPQWFKDHLNSGKTPEDMLI